MKRSAHLAVESTDASESSGHGDLLAGQGGFVEQLLGEVRASGQGDLERRGAKVLSKQPTQMPGRQAHPFAESVDAGSSNTPSPIKLSARETTPTCRTTPACRAMLQDGSEAWTEARGLGSGSGWKVADVLVFRRPRRADRPAVDASAGYADEEPAVESCVARPARAIASHSIDYHHDGSLARAIEVSWSDSDLITNF